MLRARSPPQKVLIGIIEVGQITEALLQKLLLEHPGTVFLLAGPSCPQYKKQACPTTPIQFASRFGPVHPPKSTGWYGWYNRIVPDYGGVTESKAPEHVFSVRDCLSSSAQGTSMSKTKTDPLVLRACSPSKTLIGIVGIIEPCQTSEASLQQYWSVS